MSNLLSNLFYLSLAIIFYFYKFHLLLQFCLVILDSYVSYSFISLGISYLALILYLTVLVCTVFGLSTWT